MADNRIELNVTPAVRKRVEELAERDKTSLTGAIRTAILQATKREGIPDEQEVLELLGEAARTGNVSAMKELRAYHRERDARTEDDPLAEFDELASRRAA